MSLRSRGSNPFVIGVITRLVKGKISLFSKLTSQWTYFPVYGAEIISAKL